MNQQLPADSHNVLTTLSHVRLPSYAFIPQQYSFSLACRRVYYQSATQACPLSTCGVWEMTAVIAPLIMSAPWARYEMTGAFEKQIFVQRSFDVC
ncbi:hypothetical protein BaRGS_00016100 [Batillaria attramentaria]|uniref:Uncharacterized protein n=1 Tax=Batillaria attramentaria TaxID=370345 RepID=A0ABD0L046_9CAEN